jgi:hypothetical protein
MSHPALEPASYANKVLASLRALESAIAAGQPPSPNPALRAALAQMEALTAAIPDGVDANLRHYLLKRSYQKARLLLEGGDPEAGPCPR